MRHTVLIRPSTPGDLDGASRPSTPGTSATAQAPSRSIRPTRQRWHAAATTCSPRACPISCSSRTARVLGFAYANQFRPRPAYRFCLEDSLYLAADTAGRGYGRLLLAELLARCEAAERAQMLAVIGDSANAGSIGVHRALGFAHIGTIAAAGWKFDAWRDVVVMQRSLGPGAAAPPP